jgi:hypothetical protein
MTAAATWARGTRVCPCIDLRADLPAALHARLDLCELAEA